ncbi:MAG: 4-hydroxybenzoate polyprenyltransferase [Myxococcota bacterium]
MGYCEAMRFWLKASRPGLWFPTLWLYGLPLGGQNLLDSPAFWAGLLFVSFPLNLLTYGWNDLVDVETDANNPRKDSWLFGARGTPEQLSRLPWAMAAFTVLGFAPVVALGGLAMLPLLAAIVGVIALYNLPERGLRGRPPLELLCQAGYLLVIPMSAWLNAAPLPAWPTWLYLCLFCVQSQLIGEVMDIDPDRESGRKTTATVLGTQRTKLLIIATVAAEVALLVGVYSDLIFAGMLSLFLVWLLLDVTVLFGSRRYTLNQMKLFGVGSNLVAFGSMIYVWWSGCLLI